MSASFTSSDIRPGADVFGADGEKVGTVAAVYPGYIVVEKGFFFPTDYYVPMSAVAWSDSNQVYLNVAKDAALQSGWDALPVEVEITGGATATGTAGAAKDFGTMKDTGGPAGNPGTGGQV
jgi:hypothetical protein